MKDPERHFITKAIKRLRIWFSQKKRVMAQAQDLQRQLEEAWREKAQLEAELEQRRTQIAHLQPVYLEVCAENDALIKEIKRLPDKLKWVSDNASHHTSSHWLKTQLYGLARELETGYMNVGTKDFYRVDALTKRGDDATTKT